MTKFYQLAWVSAVIAVLAIGGAGCSRQARATRALTRADQEFEAGDYDKAEVDYITVLRLDRTSAKAFQRLGTMMFEQGRLAQSYSLLARAMVLDSNNLDLHVEMGLCYLTAGGAREAHKNAQFVLERRPDDLIAPILYADSAVTLKDVEAAIPYLQKLNVPAAKRAPIDTAIGSLYLRQGEMKSAIEAFDRARSEDSKYGPLYGELGTYYWMQKDTKHADEAFKYSADSAPTRSPRRLRYAQFKVQNKDVDGAKKMLQEMAAKSPDCLPATIALANIDAGLTNYAEADELTAKVLARDPQNYDALMLNARLGTLEGQPTKAISQYEKLAKDYPKSPVILYQLATAYNAANDSANAMTTLYQALAINTNFLEAQLFLAELRLSKGDVNSAISSLKDVAQHYPHSIEPQMALADAYYHQGDFDDSAAIYQRLESINSTNAEIPMALGLILLQGGRVDDAGKQFERALEISPGYLNALERLCDIEVSRGEYDKALGRVKSVMRFDTNSPQPELLVAKIYLGEHDGAKAIAVLQKTIQAHPDYSPAYVMLGNVYTESGQAQKALETARQLLEKHPDDPGGLMQVAVTLDAQQDTKGARTAYEKVLKVSPNNGTALNNLAYIYAEGGEADKALDLAQRARNLAPHDPSTADTYGWVLYRKGDYTQAALALQEAANNLNTAADVQYHLGMVRYMLGEQQPALVSLRYAARASQQFPGKDEAAAALAVLEIDPKTANADARALLEKRIASQPGDPIALTKLASIYQREGNTDKAVATYEAAVKANPKNAHAMLELAQLYSAHHDQIAKAYNLAKDAYKLASDDIGVKRTVGRLAYLSGDYRLSLSLLQEAARQMPSDPDVLLDAAEASYSMGQVNDAVSGARQALQVNPSFPRAVEAKKFIDMIALADNPAQAAASAVQVDAELKADANNVPALMASGVIAEQKADVAAATSAFEKVLAQYPEFTPAMRHLAVLYAQKSIDDKQAAQIAFKAHEAYPDDTKVTESLGIIDYRLGDYGKAAKFLKDSGAATSTDLFYLGMAQYQLKENSESKKTLLRALDLKLPKALEDDARKTLASLK